MSDTNMRTMGWFLALLGFVPFLAGTMIEFLPTNASTATLKAYWMKMFPLYGAIILSFLGGIRWGIAITDQTTERQTAALAWSVVPSLWAWAAVFFAAPINYLMLAAGFAAMGLWDRKLAADPRVPVWFVTLRKVLSWLVTIAMLAAAVGANSTLIGIALS